METTAAPTEFQPLPTTREERGRQIARQGGIRPLGARYVVPSQSASPSVPTYLVDLVDETCTCPDFETRRQRCKHQEAVWFWLAWEGTVNAETGEVVLPKKQQSRQVWSAYNRAQTTERERVPLFLRSLCDSIVEPVLPPGAPGRRPIPLREGIFGIVMKVYSMCSGRRAESDIRACVDRGLISRAWDANTLFRVMEDPATTEILTRLIPLSAAPLAGIESEAGQFAQDATGFKTSVRRLRAGDDAPVTCERWHDQKRGDEKRGRIAWTHVWVKLHVMVGTLTNAVTAARVTVGTASDSPELPELLATTAERFRVKQVSADKGYLAHANLEAIVAAGAEPFIPFKTNSRGMDSPSEHWRKMWAYFELKTEEFLRHYHRRSNIESTFGAIKQKFGGSLRSKLFVAQQNEVLGKVLLWNLTCIVQAIEEFGVEAEFSRLVTP